MLMKTSKKKNEGDSLNIKQKTNRVCDNFCSNLEHNNEIYSLAQYEASKQQQQLDDKSESQPVNSNSSNSNNNENKQQLTEIKQQTQIETIIANTTHNNNTTTTTNNNNNNNIITKTEQLIKPSISTTIPTTTPPAIQISPPNSSSVPINTNNDLDLDICSNIAIKREQSPPLPNNNINKNNKTNTHTSDGKRIFIDSKPPLLINEQSICNQKENNTNNNNNVLNKQQKKLYEEKRPKSVTASVFRSAPLVNSELPLPSTPSPIYPPLNAAPRATSVTASVFTPISQLCNKQQQHIVKTNSTTKAAIITQHLKHHQQQQQQQSPQQQQDMSKGYLSFGDDANELTMLKEEPDELEQLTPSSVDACMPLEEAAPLFGEMLGLMNSYSCFLPDEINSLDSSASSSTDTNQKCNNSNGGNDLMSTFPCFFPSEMNSLDSSASSTTEANQQKCNDSNHSNSSNSTSSSSHSSYSSRSNLSCNNSNNNTNSNNNNNNNNNQTNNSKSGGRIDPFINYREESNDTICSQHLLSPSVASKSPEASSLPSLCSPNSLSQDDEFAFMTMSVDDEIDMTMRAPYIPMSEQEDLPLLTADDLMWCGSNGFPELNMQKDVDDIQQLHQLQSCESNRNMLVHGDNYQDQSPHLNQTHFSNSLCSSPASTVSSLSPSPISSQPMHKPQQDNGGVFGTESSELAALLCGTGSGTLSILGNTTGSSDGGNENERRNLNALGNGGNGGSSCGDFRLQQLQQQLQKQEQQRRQQQQQQQQLLNLNIDCKKEKYDNSISPNLCDSIGDAFENVYSKDSTNLDCWNEFLQINVNDTSSSSSPPTSTLTSPQQSQLADDCKQQLPLAQQLQLKQQQQAQHSQNIVLNAVPLITIQNNKNMLLQQQHEMQQRSKFLTHDEALLAAASHEGHNKVTTIKLLKGSNATTIANAATTIRVIESGKMQPVNGKAHLPQHQQQSNHQSAAHKRHLVSSIASTQSDTKRMKSAASNGSTTIELHNVPQLLQQLVAPMPQAQQVNIKEQKPSSKAPISRWMSGGANSQKFKCLQQNQQQQQQQAQEQQKQQSNSVLKNLLISGCDDIMVNAHETNSMGGGISPSLTKPLHCHTSTASILRNHHHNPMIGGIDMQPSPIFSIMDDSSSLPGLTSCDTDSNSDSGIDDISMTDAASPLKLSLDVNNDNERNIPNKDMLLLKCFDSSMSKKIAVDVEEQQVMQPKGASHALAAEKIIVDASSRSANASRNVATIKDENMRRSAISYLDNNNPLLTPFLMELCNDDYNMNAETFLETDDIEHVLNEWTQEMA